MPIPLELGGRSFLWPRVRFKLPLLPAGLPDIAHHQMKRLSRPLHYTQD